MYLHELLREAAEQEASDLHITVSTPPILRINGVLVPMEGREDLTPQMTEQMAFSIMDEEQQERFRKSGELDFAYSLSGVGRLRVNVYRQRGTVAMALRFIPFQVRSMESLGLPPVVETLARKTNGLILVTGPTGSGKSTTLAAIIDFINQSRHCHILTLEDPIEYLHRHKKSMVNQREVGVDSKSFVSSLRAALRQDPDVILVGEMRDLDTISITLTAAETGHLVLATLHTSSAAQTVERVVDVFPPHQQDQIKVQLASTLQGIIAQQLLPRIDVPGRVAAFEILVATPAVRNLIREGKTHQLPAAIETGARYGMRTMEASLRELFQQGIISREEFEARTAGEVSGGDYGSGRRDFI